MDINNNKLILAQNIIECIINDTKEHGRNWIIFYETEHSREWIDIINSDWFQEYVCSELGWSFYYGIGHVNNSVNNPGWYFYVIVLRGEYNLDNIESKIKEELI